MPSKNRISSGQDGKPVDPSRRIGVNNWMESQAQHVAVANEVPRSLLNTDGIAQGVKALTLSDLSKEYGYGDYTWSEQDENCFPEYTPPKQAHKATLPIVLSSNGGPGHHRTFSDNLSNREVVLDKDMIKQTSFAGESKCLQKDRILLGNQNDNQTKDAEATTYVTNLDHQTPRQRETLHKSSKTDNSPWVPDNSSATCLQKSEELVPITKSHSQHSGISEFAAIKHQNICKIERDMIAPRSPETTMAQSVFGTGSWIQDGAKDSSTVEIEAFAALPFSDAEIETEIEVRRSAKFLSDPKIQSCAGGSGASRASGSYSFSHSGQSGLGQASQSKPNGHDGHQKRPSESGSGSGGDEDSDHQKRIKSDIASFQERRFACPYAKNEPQFYRTNPLTNEKYMICTAGMGFENISRLKEHFTRVHSLNNPCPRCHSEFNNKATLEKHLREIEINQCSVSVKPPRKGVITPTIAAELSKRNKYRRDAVDQWNDIYRLLFPNQPLPVSGPYHELPLTTNQVVMSFARSCEEQLPLLERRLENLSSMFAEDDKGRNILTSFLPILSSDLGAWVKELAAEYHDVPVADNAIIPPRTPSKESHADSGYSTGPSCNGGCEFLGCSDCGSMSSPFSPLSSPGFTQEISSASGSAPTCIDPSQIMLLSNTGSSLEYGFPQRNPRAFQ